jgi:hypothetical protein
MSKSTLSLTNFSSQSSASNDFARFHAFLGFIQDDTHPYGAASAQASLTRLRQQRLRFLFWRLSQYLTSMGSFIASSQIERRHARQRIAEEPGRQVARLEFGSAITIRQR